MKVHKSGHLHKHYTEQFTVFLSILCAIHCLTTPILLVFAPFVASYFEQYHWVEYILVGSIFIFGITSILHGYKQHHHNKIPANLFFIGLIVMLIVTILDLFFNIHNTSTHFISGIGGILCGVGQLYNLKLSH